MRCVLALLVIVAVNAEFISIGYKNCKSSFTIDEVTADACILKEADGKKICIFKYNTKPTIRVKFTTTEAVDALTTTVKAKIGKTLLDFPLADNDACKHGISCPLEANKQYVYEQGIDIINNYPKNERVQVNWMLSHEKGHKDICIIFLAEIVD